MDAEVLHDQDLPLGVAARHGYDRGPDLLGAVVRPQAAGEQAVAVGVVHDVSAGSPAAGEGAGHELRPGVDVPPGVADHGGLARRPGGGVDPHHPLHGNREQAERIVVSEILFCGEGQARQILSLADVAGPVPGLPQPLPVKRHCGGNPVRQVAQSLRPGERPSPRAGAFQTHRPRSSVSSMRRNAAAAIAASGRPICRQAAQPALGRPETPGHSRRRIGSAAEP